MEAVLQCAASIVLCNEGLSLDYTLGNSIDNPKHLGAERKNRVLSRGFETHEELHSVLRHSSLCNRLRPVEIAIPFDKEITDGSLADKLWEAFRIVHKMNRLTGRSRLSITMRAMPLTEQATRCMRQAGLWHVDDYPKGVRWGRWTCKLGNQLEQTEWDDTWVEGKNYAASDSTWDDKRHSKRVLRGIV